MYQMTWKPKTLEINGGQVESAFEGEILLQAPKYVERIAYFKELALLSGKVLDAANTEENAERVSKMIDIARKHIVKVNLKRKDDGIVFSSIDDLEFDSDGGDILIQVCAYLLEGARLGKNLARTSDDKQK